MDGVCGGVSGGRVGVMAVGARVEDRENEREAREGAPYTAGERGRVDIAVGEGTEPLHVLDGADGRWRRGEVQGEEDGSRGVGGVAREGVGVDEGGRRAWVQWPSIVGGGAFAAGPCHG